MLNKFQDQDLMFAVEQLEQQKKDIEKIISSLKNIHPSLFDYPKVSKYNSGSFNSTIAESDGEE
tara:strand:- start:610 stop:801 length:192 start_codon:yes stop_codon:yes gene_type:complete